MIVRFVALTTRNLSDVKQLNILAGFAVRSNKFQFQLRQFGYRPRYLQPKVERVENDRSQFLRCIGDS